MRFPFAVAALLILSCGGSAPTDELAEHPCFTEYDTCLVEDVGWWCSESLGWCIGADQPTTAGCDPGCAQASSWADCKAGCRAAVIYGCTTISCQEERTGEELGDDNG